MVDTKRYFYDSVPSYQRNTSFIRNRANDIIHRYERLDNDCCSAELYNEDLIAIRDSANKIIEASGALSEECVYPKNGTEYPSTRYGVKEHDLFLDESFVPTFTFDGKIIRLFVPLTFRVNWRKAYTFSKPVRIALAKWETEHDNNLFMPISVPFFCIVKRKAYKYNPRTMLDSDNLETGRIVNEVVREIGCNDRATMMGFASTFVQIPDDEKEGCEFVFLSLEDLKSNPEELNFGNLC